MPPSKDTPKFDHTKQTSIVESHNPTYKRLLQDGNQFTFAEFNKQTKRWEPEPQYVLETRISGQDMLSNVERLILALESTKTVIANFQKAILDNLDLVVEEKK